MSGQETLKFRVSIGPGCSLVFVGSSGPFDQMVRWPSAGPPVHRAEWITSQPPSPCWRLDSGPWVLPQIDFVITISIQWALHSSPP
jgi:hypothetical protein